MPPLVSIITPTFNSERHLAETVASVLGQTVTDWELILSDDGSTDGTVALARRFAQSDPRIRVIENPPARHPGTTRNAGLKIAAGETIAFLDSDDIWLPEKLEIQLEAVRRTANPGICHTLARNFSDRPGPLPLGMFTHPLPPNPESHYAYLLLTCNRICTPSILLAREFADEIGPFAEDPLLAIGEDWDYVLRAVRRRPLIFVPKELVKFRVHSTSTMQTRARRWERTFEIYRRAEERGEMPPGLRKACYSAAWLGRAEVELERGEPGWRSSFLRAFALAPFNWRRWPALLSLFLNRRLMQFAYSMMKSLQRRTDKFQHLSPPPGEEAERGG